MIDRLVLASIVPWPLIYLFMGICVFVFAFVIVRYRVWPLWRIMASLFITLALIDPRLVREERVKQKDIILALVDRTTSQTLGNREALTDKTVKHLQLQLKRFPETELRIETVYDLAPETHIGNYEEGTFLIRVLRRALSAVPEGRLAGVVIITDGQVHDMSEEVTRSLSITSPIHLLLTGDSNEKDRRLIVEQFPSYGLVGKDALIQYRVEDHAGVKVKNSTGELAQVTLRQNKNIIGKATVRIGVKSNFKISLKHAGPTLATLEVSPVPEELSNVNNKMLVRINGIRDRLRVLLVSGQPHAGERAWRNLLKSDPAVDLVHFTILRPPDKDDFTPLNEIALIAFPTRELFELKLKEFDLVIFDRYVVRNVLPTKYFLNIVNYVRGGGALLLALGPEYAEKRSLYNTPLGRILPAKPSGKVINAGFQPYVTEIGRRHPITGNLTGFGKLLKDGGTLKPTWGRWFRQIETSARAIHTLMRGHSSRPLLVLNQYEEGRVVVILSDHIWLWSRGFEGGGPYAELLRRAAHWLMKEPELEAENLLAEIKDGKLLIKRRSLSDALRTITVLHPNGVSKEYPVQFSPNGVTRLEVPADAVGLYHVSDGTLNTQAATGTINRKEFSNLLSNEHILKPLVKKTRGGTFWVKEMLPNIRMVGSNRNQAGKEWIGLVKNKAYVTMGLTQVSLLPPALLIFVILGTIMLAWWREGNKNK